MANKHVTAAAGLADMWHIRGQQTFYAFAASWQVTHPPLSCRCPESAAGNHATISALFVFPWSLPPFVSIFKFRFELIPLSLSCLLPFSTFLFGPRWNARNSSIIFKSRNFWVNCHTRTQNIGGATLRIIAGADSSCLLRFHSAPKKSFARRVLTTMGSVSLRSKRNRSQLQRSSYHQSELLMYLVGHQFKILLN